MASLIFANKSSSFFTRPIHPYVSIYTFDTWHCSCRIRVTRFPICVDHWRSIKPCIFTDCIIVLQTDPLSNFSSHDTFGVLAKKFVFFGAKHTSNLSSSSSAGKSCCTYPVQFEKEQQCQISGNSGFQNLPSA